MADNLKKFPKKFENTNINPAIRPADWLGKAQIKLNKDGSVELLEDKYQDG